MQKCENFFGDIFRNIKKTAIKYSPLIIFFFVILIQHAYIYLYHDDFAYASLTYVSGYRGDIQGKEFSLRQMVAFLYTHYFSWGGRILPIFTLLSLLRWHIWVFRVAQSIVITAILFFSMKIINQTKLLTNNHGLISVILVCLYGLIPINVHNNGTYWASASVMYVWPFFWLFVGTYKISKIENFPKRIWLSLIIFLIFFVAGFSQELFIFPAFFLIVGLIFTQFITKEKPTKIRLALSCLAFLLIGFVLMILAPGNFQRADSSIYKEFYTMSYFERIVYNFPSFIQIAFGKQNIGIWLFFIIANIISTYTFIKKWNKHKILNKSLLLALTLFFTILLAMGLYSTLLGFNHVIDKILYWIDGNLFYSKIFWGVFVLSISLSSFLFSCYFKSFTLFGLFFGGLLSQISMLILPSVNSRYALILFFSLFPLSTAIFIKSFQEINLPKLKLIVVFCLIIGAFLNTVNIISGYQKNSPTHIRNQQTLIWSRIALQQGFEIRTINLQKLPNDKYSGAMPYMTGYDYINYWIKDYYMVPQEIILEWDN